MPPVRSLCRALFFFLLVLLSIPAPNPFLAQPKSDKSESARLLDRSKNEDDIKALATLDRALKLDPRNVEAWYRRGWIYQKMNRRPESRDAYEKALALAPCHVRSLNNMGTLLVDAEKNTEAKPFFEKALRCDPRSYLAQYNLGNIAMEEGDGKAAEARFLAALQIKPDHARSLHNLGILILQRGEKETGIDTDEMRRAVTYLEKSVKADPENPLTHLNLARAYLALGRRVEAGRSLDNAARFSGNDARYAKKIAELRAKLRQTR